MSNRDNSVLYVGVTSDLKRRVLEHENHSKGGFTAKYNCVKLVYVEEFHDIRYAIAREKVLKRWNRAWKYKLIRSLNPDIIDLWCE